MNWKPILKVICLTAVAAPATLAAVGGLTITPEAAAVMAVFALIGGLTLSELQPGLSGEAPRLSSEDVERVARRGLELMREQPAEGASRG